MSRAFCTALSLLTASASAGRAQQPILEVSLPGVGQTLVQGQLTEDGVLELPTAPLEELTGEELGDVAYVSLPALRSALGAGVEIEYDSRRALIRISDPMGRLAATRRLYDQRLASGQGRPTSFLLGGPYAVLTAESGGRSLFEGGWNFGRVSVGVAQSTETGPRWNASVRVLQRAYLSYQDAEGRGPAFGLRWAGGRTFVETVYAPETEDFRARAATSLGPWTFYAQEDGTAAISHRSVVQVTVGHTPEGFATRLSYGRHPSPLSVPRVF
jgi:hypothetical protein